MAQNIRTAASAANRASYRTTDRTSYRTSYRNGSNVSGRNTAYVNGNAAYDLSIQRQLEEEPRRKLSNETRKNREKAHHMSLGYVIFLVAALCACGIILINYVQLQAELTARTENVAVLEGELNNLKLANDEEYSRITRNVDLDEIKRIAIGELGMTYAEEGQIVIYKNTGTDYMRQVMDAN